MTSLTKTASRFPRLADLQEQSKIISSLLTVWSEHCAAQSTSNTAQEYWRHPPFGPWLTAAARKTTAVLSHVYLVLAYDRSDS